MKSKLIAVTILFFLFGHCYSQQQVSSENYSWLTGEWIGEGSGQPGQGGGTFTFSVDLDKNVIIRKSHSEYPAAENKPAVVHDDLMIIYNDDKENLNKAIYFDNEGHVIHYSISVEGNKIIMTGDRMPDSPVFRLTYTLLADGKLNTLFEMSKDGTNYIPYIEGISRRK
jgi:hypothetical protein